MILIPERTSTYLCTTYCDNTYTPCEAACGLKEHEARNTVPFGATSGAPVEACTDGAWDYGSWHGYHLPLYRHNVVRDQASSFGSSYPDKCCSRDRSGNQRRFDSAVPRSPSRSDRPVAWPIRAARTAESLCTCEPSLHRPRQQKHQQLQL